VGGETSVDLKSLVREFPDFPIHGVSFKDITPVLADAEALRFVARELTEWVRPLAPDVIVGGEARGFVLGGVLAHELGCGFVPARRPGKLPGETVSAEYMIEYGSGALELSTAAIREGARVVIHDDVLALGGTSRAMIDLIERLGGEVVGCAFIIELTFLNGRSQIERYPVHSVISY
jgi:adenine phosphoribosyltransferase